jgi:hypothetical protein
VLSAQLLVNQRTSRMVLYSGDSIRDVSHAGLSLSDHSETGADQHSSVCNRCDAIAPVQNFAVVSALSAWSRRVGTGCGGLCRKLPVPAPNCCEAITPCEVMLMSTAGCAGRPGAQHSCSWPSPSLIVLFICGRAAVGNVLRHSPQDTLKVLEHWSYCEPLARNFVLTNSTFVRARALLED